MLIRLGLYVGLAAGNFAYEWLSGRRDWDRAADRTFFQWIGAATAAIVLP